MLNSEPTCIAASNHYLNGTTTDPWACRVPAWSGSHPIGHCHTAAVLRWRVFAALIGRLWLGS